MTTDARTTNRRPARRNRTLLPVAAVTTLAFLGLSGFLGVQMADGKDPLIGSGKQQTAQAKPAVVRKVIITRKVIIKEAAPAASSGTGTGTSYGSAGYSGGYSSGGSSAGSYSAPAQSAPVQSAPAPVQSGSS